MVPPKINENAKKCAVPMCVILIINPKTVNYHPLSVLGILITLCLYILCKTVMKQHALKNVSYRTAHIGQENNCLMLPQMFN